MRGWTTCTRTGEPCGSRAPSTVELDRHASPGRNTGMKKAPGFGGRRFVRLVFGSPIPVADLAATGRLCLAKRSPVKQPARMAHGLPRNVAWSRPG